MRFVWAVVAFVLAAVLIGAGIAQRTVLLGPETEEAEVAVDDGLPFVVVDGAVLGSRPGAQTLTAEGDGVLFAAYGRTSDVAAWLRDASYTRIALDEDGEIVTSVVSPEEDADEAADTDEATEIVAGRSPLGSDLWLEEFQDTGTLEATLQLPEDMSVILATDGTQPAPAQLVLAWPIDNATPWAGPLIALGGVLIVLGIVLYLLGLRHVRRSRGPRRRGLPLPATEPLETIPPGDDKGVIAATPSRRPLPGARSLVAIPLAASVLVLSGCSADAWPQLGPTPEPTPTPSVVMSEGQDAPAVTQAQAERIIARVADTVAQADATGDAELAATRLSGAPLEERSANYLVRTKVEGYATLPAISATALGFTLPEAQDEWPRSFMMVVGDEGAESDGATPEAEDGEESGAEESTTTAPTIVLLTQDDPWSEYRVTYMANLAAAATMPSVAGATIGATQVPPNSPFLLLAPELLAEAYADVLNNGDASAYASLFEAEGDQFRTKVAEDRASRLEEFNQTAAETGSLTFSSAAGSHDPFALATLESGAIVAVSLTETDTVKPTDADAVIKLDNNPTVQALAGTASSATGFNTNYSDQLFFYVPNQASGERIQLLGYGTNILSAGVIR